MESSISAERIEASLSAAQTYLDSNDIAKAQAILVTLIDRAPREHRARELYGQSLVLAAMDAQRQGNTAVAIELRRKAYEQYRVVVELQPRIAGLQQSAGQIAILAGDTGAALDHFQKAAELDGTNPQYPLFAAQLLIQAQRWNEATASLERVLRLDKDEPIAHASLAMIALEQSRFEEALDHVRRAREINPDDVGLRSQEAKVYRRSGQPRQALELLVGLNAAQRAQEIIAFEIAAAHDAMGQHLQAAQAWQHVFQADSMAPRAWFAAVRTGEALLRAGEREQAVHWLQQAELLAPASPDVMSLRAAIWP